MLKIYAIFIAALFFAVSARSQTAELNIIPQPKSVSRFEGEFKFSAKTKIVASDETGRKSAGVLNDWLTKNYGFKLEYAARAPKKNAIVFLPPTLPTQHAPVGSYAMRIDRNTIQIEALEVGQFYALQTLMQILPTNFAGEARLPAAQIADAPRFPYRGMHLDVGRHFFPVSFVKKYIDLMAQYKFNRFHWHLTEDQGWRIEIKKYPRLTEIGARRAETMKDKNFEPYVGDGVPIEGFYTQEQIKEVVAYAKEKHITVIPEIELPGHSSAALAAYPELGCKTDYKYRVQTTWGIFKEVFCPTEKTFQFLEDVLTETIALFPDSPYIHIGGDEVLKDHWKESAFVQELKQKENLKDEHEVQSYFIRRIEKFINSKGKKIIGWDEILEGGLAPNATVMSWRGTKGGIEAARAKHDVIMTPTDYLYFDYGQGDPQYEPINIGNYVTLEKVYGFEPVPKELNDEEKKHILGAQANLWTEYIKTPEKVEYMVFPRMLALSEVVWSAPENKNFDDFRKRLSNHFARLDRQNVNYRIPEPIGLRNVLIESKKNDIVTFERLNSLSKSWKIYYTLDGSEPTEKSKLYEKAIVEPIGWDQKFELKTIVVNDEGRKSVPYQATIWRREWLASVAEPINKKQGVNFAFYKQNFASAGDIEKATAAQSGETKSIQLGQFREKIADKTPFALIFDGFLNVPKDEIYEFQLETLGGGALWIDGEKVVDNGDNLNVRQVKTGIVPLKQGYHRLRLRYFKGQGESVLGLRWGVKGQGLTRIYGGELFH